MMSVLPLLRVLRGRPHILRSWSRVHLVNHHKLPSIVSFSTTTSSSSSSSLDAMNVVTLQALESRAETGDHVAALNYSRQVLDSNTEDIEIIQKAVSWLEKAAQGQIPEAQYMLGVMALEEIQQHTMEDEDEDLKALFDESLGDAEASRERMRQNTSLQSVKDIRKVARKKFMHELKKKKKTKPRQQERQHEDPVVRRVTREELDDAFGPRMITSILDPESSGSSSSSIHLMSKDIHPLEWIRQAAQNGYVVVSSHMRYDFFPQHNISFNACRSTDAKVYLGNVCMTQEQQHSKWAIHWYSEAAAENHVDALYNLGMIHYQHYEQHDDVTMSLTRAWSCFETAAANGDASAQFWLGHVYHVGLSALSIEPDLDQALTFLHASADVGEHGGAQVYLSQIYRFMPGRELDFWHYVQRAARDHDEHEAWLCIAEIYQQGLVLGKLAISKDVGRAQSLYVRAATLGNSDALCSLGAMAYQNRAYVRALALYQAAADRHHVEAWKNIAQMHFLGQGVPVNEATAHSILRMISSRGEEKRNQA